MVGIHDYDIECIEDEIVWRYNHPNNEYPNFDCLLSMRKRMINKRVLEHQKDILYDIIAFNDALTDALKEMYDKAHSIWDAIKDNEAFGDNTEVTAKCFLGYDYPALHPVQGKDRQELWNAICDSGWNTLYDDGITLPTLTLPSYDEPFDSFIGMDCPPPNWNEGLDQELTKDLHLTSAFHNLFDHMKFAITDFIYVRDFEMEINVETNQSIRK